MYENFEWQRMPLPQGIAAVVRRPKYDESFNVEEFMRAAGYRGPFKLPSYVVAVKKQLRPVSMSHHGDITFGNIRGNRGYISNKLLGLPEISDPHEEWLAATEEDRRFRNRAPTRANPYGMPPNYGRNGGIDSCYNINIRRQQDPRMKGGSNQLAVHSASDLRSYPTSQNTAHSSTSRSSSSHLGPVTEAQMNLFNSPNSGQWSQNPPPNSVQSQYVPMGNYPTARYPNLSDVNIANGAPTGVVKSDPVLEQEPINQETIQNTAMAEISEFFVPNTFPHPENADNLRTAQMNTPPMAPYGNMVFKTEEVDYGYEPAPIYEQVVQEPIFSPPQHDQQMIRTAAGGESQVIEADYNQPQQNTSNYQYNASNYHFDVRTMPMEDIKDIYVAPEAQQYQQPMAEQSTHEGAVVQGDNNNDNNNNNKQGDDNNGENG
ncbi:hypothetical protein Q1695_004101 [Nippostrongylus brasiliensis]|nr:hypothetical protein Q1695_004101 [Nippostrongylus brasiliensis]